MSMKARRVRVHQVPKRIRSAGNGVSSKTCASMDRVNVLAWSLNVPNCSIQTPLPCVCRCAAAKRS